MFWLHWFHRKHFLNLACVLSFYSYVFCWAGHFVFLYLFLQNFLIKFDITFSTKWNPDKIFKNIILSAVLGAGWCHGVLKRCFSGQDGAGLKIIGPPVIFIVLNNFKKPFLLWVSYLFDKIRLEKNLLAGIFITFALCALKLQKMCPIVTNFLKPNCYLGAPCWILVLKTYWHQPKWSKRIFQ